jgi:uncharacterized membrane protein YqaE (UPF0057 family)
MKKLLVPFILCTLAGILFPSCSKTSKLSFTKRHYRSGYFVEHVGKVNTRTNSYVASLPKSVNHVSSLPAVVKSNTPVAINTVAVTLQKPAMINKSRIQKEKPVCNQPVPISTNQNTLLINTKANANSSSEEEYDNHTRVDDNVAFVVVVLCAIFIPPLGVALAYGIHGYFWIDLILTLIFFIPGMIFALIVVLS